MTVNEFECGNIRIFIGKISDLDISKINAYELSHYRSEKIKRIKNKKNKLQSVAAELVLNYGVKKCFGIDAPVNYMPDEHGKPFFTDINAFFSLSHSDEYAVCALSDCAVGVDIQKKRNVNMKLAERFFTSDEFEAIQKNPTDDFNRIWARKEALSKAVGLGLQIGFSNINVMDDCILYDGKSYRISDIDFNKCYSTAVAVIFP